MLRRFREGGYEAIEPRSRRPNSCAHQVGPEVQAAILSLREELAAAGDDAGAHSIAHHLAGRVKQVPSDTTIWRILKRHGQITPQPHKRPRSSFVRFEAELPNEMWQCDSTPWRLADGSPAEILNLLDDHSRLLLNSAAYPTLKALDVVQSFTAAADNYGLPASFLSDNAAVFSGRSRRGKVPLELELERLHQTLKRYLRQQPPAQSLAHLQLQLDNFRSHYNQQRTHPALGGQTPLVAFNARVKATPTLPLAPTHYRVRQDQIDDHGSVTLRYLGRLRHIRVGVRHRNRKVQLLVAGDDVRIVTTDGELIRHLRLDPDRLYFGLGGRWPVHNVLQQESGMS